jgi:hypothetical protein
MRMIPEAISAQASKSVRIAAASNGFSNVAKPATI